MNHVLLNHAREPLTNVSGGWLGCLELEFSAVDGATQLSRSHMQAPLKVQRPFYPEGADVCHVVTLHTAGGVVGGDRLSSQIQLHPQAQALITSAAAGKIYRSNGLQAQQQTHIQVSEGACLEYLPQETIVFDGADYCQNLRVDLAEEALWLGWEVTRLGRSARGERFESGTWRSHIEVWQQNQLIWVDPQWIAGGTEMMDSSHGLAGCPVVGSFAVVGRSLSKPIVEEARSLWQSQAEPSTADVGVTRLMSGMLCRYRGSSTAEARRWFTAVWGLLRGELMGRSPCKPRVWQ